MNPPRAIRPGADRFGGLIAYLVTPLSADGRTLRTELFQDYVDALLEGKEIDGIACLANDFAYFSDDERRQIARCVADAVRGRVPLFVYTSAVSTIQTISFSRHAMDCGASRVIVSPLNYLAISDDDILRHFEAVAKAVGIPIHIYNNPNTTKRDMSIALLRRIVEAIGASSIKEAGDLTKVQQARLAFGGSVAVHAGFHFMALGAFALGAVGWDAGLVPRLVPAFVRLFKSAVRENSLREAQDVFFSLLPLFEFFRTKGVLASLKALAAGEGLDLGGVRGPIAPLGIEEVSRLRAIAEFALDPRNMTTGATFVHA